MPQPFPENRARLEATPSWKLNPERLQFWVTVRPGDDVRHKELFVEFPHMATDELHAG